MKRHEGSIVCSDFITTNLDSVNWVKSQNVHEWITVQIHYCVLSFRNHHFKTSSWNTQLNKRKWLTGEMANRRMVPFLISLRLWMIIKEESVQHSFTESSSQSEGENSEAHLLSDIKLRPVSITQSKLLWSWQRPAEEAQKNNPLYVKRPTETCAGMF